MSNSNGSFKTLRYILQTLDPVHIGTGGMRLGRVDLSIVREPGTRLPKIPGTSLSGVIRSYAAYRYGKRRCAGQGQAREGHKGHCCRPTCPVCYTFGYFKGKEEGNSGVVSIGDARILFFPVYSMKGPVWVSTQNILKEAGFKIVPPEIDQTKTYTTMEWNKPLNLGWLMVEMSVKVEIKDAKERDLNLGDSWNVIKDHIVIVSDKLFSQVVNSNLEVRTSVSINPETGAADDGALFTYEAIPRATFLWTNVVMDDYKNNFLKTEKKCKCLDKDCKTFEDNAGDTLGQSWESPADVVTAGLEWAEHLGVGGMGTRGFGRVRKVTNGIVQFNNDVCWNNACTPKEDKDPDNQANKGEQS